MVGNPFLFDTGAIIVTAAALAFLARFIRVPTIVVYIIAGLFLGPIAGIITVEETIEVISELGIALLLFLVALELSLEKIRDVGRVAVAAGVGQIVFTAVGGFVISFLLGFSTVESLFVAIAMTFSSTVVVVKLLTEKGDIESLYGRIAVGIFLIQDIVVVLALTVLAGLAGPGDLELGSAMVGIARAFGGMTLLLIIALLSARYVLPPLFRWLSRSLEAMFIWGLTWCFVLVMAAEAMHLSVEIGAFLAGISLAQLPFAHELRRRVHPLVNFFIAVFFVSLGIQMQLSAALEHLGPAVALSLFVLIGKSVMFMVIIARFGYGERTVFFTSITVAQISEFSFIFAALALQSGFIDESILSLIAVVGLVTIAGSAYMITFNHQLYSAMRGSWLFRLLGVSSKEEKVQTKELHGDHVIIVGMNALGRRLVHEVGELGLPVVAVDTDPLKLEGLSVPTVLGDAIHPEILEKAGFDRALLLVSALHIEEANNMLAYRCSVAGVPCSIHAFDRTVTGVLNELGVTHLIRSKEEGLSRVIDVLREQRVIGG